MKTPWPTVQAVPTRLALAVEPVGYTVKRESSVGNAVGVATYGCTQVRGVTPIVVAAGIADNDILPSSLRWHSDRLDARAEVEKPDMQARG